MEGNKTTSETIQSISRVSRKTLRRKPKEKMYSLYELLTNINQLIFLWKERRNNILEPIIKWSGSKRSQAVRIISYFPKEVDTYYEPFCGGVSVLRRLLDSDIKVNKYVCSDICSPLIELWNEIKNNPQKVIDTYKYHHSLFSDDKDYYYKIRKEFNEKHNPMDFLFLLRTCANGMPRFNKSGNFNTSVHHGRDGIKPDKLSSICNEWSNLLNKYNVIFECVSYEKIQTNKNDFMYLDPPYANTKGMYYGGIDTNSFWNWIRSQKSKYVLSFDGISGSDNNTFDVPCDLYKEHIYIKSGNSSFKRLTFTSNVDIVYESLYIA